VPEPLLAVAPPEQIGRQRLLVSPFQFGVRGEDNLRIVSRGAAPSVVLFIVGRFLERAGVIVPFQHRHVPSSNRTQVTTDFSLGEGFILNLVIGVTSGTPALGELFVQAHIIRGISGATVRLGTMLQGYCAVARDLAWPGSPLEAPGEGPAKIRAVSGTDPAAGVEITETVPTGARWQLLSLLADLTTGVAPGLRRPDLIIDDGSIAMYRSPQPLTQDASLTKEYCWAQGMALAAAIGINVGVAGLANLPQLSAGFRFRTFTDNLAVADNWTNPVMHLLEWVEP